MSKSKTVEPLVRALARAGLGGFPIEIWLATANAMAPAGVRYAAADVKALVRARPDQVSMHKTSGHPRYSPAPGAEALAALSVPSIAAQLEETFGPFTVEDDIADALVKLLDAPASDPGVRRYLARVLPSQCADGTGRGIEALRARASEPGMDVLLAEALDRRANRVSSTEKVTMRREAIALYAAAGQRAKAAEVRCVLSDNLATAGDLTSAIEELELGAAEYTQVAARDPFQLKFVAAAQLNLGRLYSRAHRRRDARAATRKALSLFQTVASEDRRFIDEVHLARRQLKQLRWWGSAG